MPKLYSRLAGLLVVLAIVGGIYGKGRLDKEKNARTQDAILATEACKRLAALCMLYDGNLRIVLKHSKIGGSENSIE